MTTMSYRLPRGRFRHLVARLGSMTLLLAIVGACGGRTTSPGDVNDAASDGASPGSDASEASDGGVEPADGPSADAAGGCVELPAEGTPCVPGQRSCDRVNLCCASEARCDPTTKMWKLVGPACLRCDARACGNRTCAGDQLCVAVHAPGAPGATPSYECMAYPTACAREWTCACVEKNLPAGCTPLANGCSDPLALVSLACMGL